MKDFGNGVWFFDDFDGKTFGATLSEFKAQHPELAVTAMTPVYGNVSIPRGGGSRLDLIGYLVNTEYR